MRALTIFIHCFSTIALLATPLFSIDSESITRVDEDWELVVREPSPTLDSPQISTWMSPTDSLDGKHFATDFNHAQRPDFSSGGFQIKAMDWESLLDDRISESGDYLSNDNETIRWTQRMEIKGNALEFSIHDGTSQSWGSFGGPYTKVRFDQSPVANLNAYSVNKSVEWAGVGFGGNRIESFTLKRVRIYVNDQLFASVDVNQVIQ